MPSVKKVTKNTENVTTVSEKSLAEARAVIAAYRANRPAPSRYGSTVSAVTPVPAGEDKLPRQARVVLNAIRAFKKPVAVNLMVASLVKAGLETRQDPNRIYTFYRARLLGLTGGPAFIKLA